MKKFEYKIEKIPIAEESEKVQEKLNELGANGWEVIGANPVGGNLNYYFKRELQNGIKKREASPEKEKGDQKKDPIPGGSI